MDAAAWQRIIIGGLGGLAAICTKYIAQDANFLDQHILDGKLATMIAGYAVLAPMLIFLGALLAWVSNETQPLKLLAMGVAAPALITTMAGGARPAIPQQQPPVGKAGFYFELSPVRNAFAEDPVVRVAQGGTLREGVELFFGYGKAEQRYWVIVGSFRDKNEADNLAAKINRESRTLKAFVGKRQPNNEYYPVIVGDYVPLSEANRIREAALRIPGVQEAYLSAYADRRP